MIKLAAVDMTKTLTKKAYKKQFSEQQARLVLLLRKQFVSKMPVILVFEGWDASGKGGTIRRLLKNHDPRHYHVWSTTAPTHEELSHHYLRRFWLRLPARGRVAVFDRSWYGRVLVERVEGFAEKDAWKRAYDELNQFEKLLVEDGALVLKFFLHISKDEQHKRFKAREDNPLKAWKMTAEDYRNRRKWDDYVVAIDDMLAKTDTAVAPWHVIAANDKRFARSEVQRIMIRAMERALK
ncbi:MAG TPA: UDP-galactose-lipid carrier transferase [Planctomycetota bacterium]|nr:UDP-galactose-lipid carrier transferase [Planctomycetota bacterium]